MSVAQLRSIAAELEALRARVRDKMNESSAAESDQLFLQILEINHRLLMIDQTIFRAGTLELGDQVEAVRAATGEIQDKIDDIEQLAGVIEGIKSLLGIVDSVIDLLT